MESFGSYLHGSDVYATRTFVKCLTNQQQTISHLYAGEVGRNEELEGYIHHWVVLSKLLLPLEMFGGLKHLTNIMYNIAKGIFSGLYNSFLVPTLFTALDHTHKAGIFHCDLSVPNIMIDAEGNG